jgi:hypothetical protein
MSDTLSANFVDGSDVEISTNLERRRVEVTAYDEKTRQKYQLTFADCTLIMLTYSDVEQDWVDINNLTDGIEEVANGNPGIRVFRVGFVDESVLEIHCRSFSMTPISS